MHLQTSTQTGRMTAVMRAVRAHPQPKVLRVGMLVEGRIVEERIVKEGSFPLEGATFEHTKEGYRLAWSRGVTGRVAQGGSIVDLAGEGSLALTDDARGKIVLGKVTLLFQLVEPPPAQTRPQLPLAVKAGLPVDWRLTIIAALSFLAHFGFVGALYSDWSDGVVDENVDIGGLVDLSARTVPQTVPLETPAEHPATSSTSSSQTSSSSTSTSTSTPSHGDPDARAAALSRQAEAMQMDLLAALGGSVAVDNALRRSNIPSPNLDEAAQQNTGVKPGEDLKLATNGGVIARPGDENGLSKLGVRERGPDHKVVAQDVGGPKTTVDFQVKPPPGGTVPIRNLEAVIAQLRPSFRSCYNKGVQSQPDMQGDVVLRVKLGPNGDVVSVTKVDGQGLSEFVEQCSAKHLKNASFDPPGGSGTQFDVPLKFFTQTPR